MTVNEKINIHIASDEKMNKDFVDACLRAERDEITEPENHLYFEDAKTLLHVLSNQRLSLLSILFQLGHTSIRALSKKMNRNYKNVYDDVQLLKKTGLIRMDSAKKIFVPWNKIHTEIDLAA